MSLLFVHGGDEFAKAVYANERRAYWSQALPAVLEKHGYMSVEAAGPEALALDDTWDRFDAILIARLPDAAWTPTLVERLASPPKPTLIEAPMPRSLKALLGVRSAARSSDGMLFGVNREISALGRAVLGVDTAGPVMRSTQRRVARLPELDWTAIESVPISLQRAAAWRAPGWEAEHWESAGDGEMLAEWAAWDTPPARSPAVVRWGNLFGCSVGLFAHLAQFHTSEPFDGGEARGSRRILGLEALLTGLIDAMYRQSNAVRARVQPWPAGVGWVLNIRHDFDRPSTVDEVTRVLAGHRRARTAATWYWRSEPRSSLERSGEPADLTPARVVAGAPRQEVAFHAELLWTEAQRELAAVERAVGRRVVGMSAHGARNCFRFQGAPNVLWADQHGLDYTECLHHKHVHPHRYPALHEDGTVSVLNVLCLPEHISFDRSMRDGDVNAEIIADQIPLWKSAGGFLQIMNHPDVHGSELFDLIESVDRTGRADWTASQAADWWRRTHTSRLKLSRSKGGEYLVEAHDPIRGLVVELLAPDGSRVNYVVNLSPGVVRRVAANPLAPERHVRESDPAAVISGAGRSGADAGP